MPNKLIDIIKLLLVLPVAISFLFIIQNYVNNQRLHDEHVSNWIEHDLVSMQQTLDHNFHDQIRELDKFKATIQRRGLVDKAEFDAFAQTVIQYLPYIEYVEFGVEVTHDNRAEFEQKLSEMYQTRAAILERNSLGQLVAAGQHDDYMPILYVYPYTEEQNSIGFDPSIGKGLLNNLTMAKQSGERTLTSAIQLASTTPSQSGGQSIVILYQPIFTQDNNTKSKQFLGYVSFIINVNKFVNFAAAQKQLNGVNYIITDITEQEPKVLFSNNQHAEHASASTYIEHVYFANKVWSIQGLDYQPDNHEAYLSRQSINVLAGVFLILLLGMLQLRLWRLLTKKHHIGDQHLEPQNLDSYEALLAVTFEVPQAIIITDMHAKILRVNKAFTQITGYMEQDVLGEDPKFLSSGRQPPSFYKNMWQELNEIGRFEGEIWNRRKNGEIYPEHQTITAIKDINGNITHYVSVFSDITKQKRQEEKAKHLAFYDPLTMLPNRSLLVDRIEKELAFIKRFNRIGCLISIDIDRFDDVNKTFGYQNGDHFLIHIAERIKSYLRATDTVARLGANHFAIMLPVEDIDTETMKKQINVIIDKLLYYLSDPFEIDGTSVAIQISMGVTIIDNTFNRVSDVLRQNDLALIQAKSKEGNSVHLSEP